MSKASGTRVIFGFPPYRNTNEAQAIANEYYDKLKIKCPLYIDRSKPGVLIPHYNLDDFVPDEV